MPKNKGILVELSKKYLDKMMEQNKHVNSGDMENARSAQNERIDIARAICSRSSELPDTKIIHLCNTFEHNMQAFIEAIDSNNSENAINTTAKADATAQELVIAILHTELEEVEFLRIITPLIEPRQNKH